MTPDHLREDYDPEPDYERIDAAYDARREDEAAGERPARDFTEEEWEVMRGSDFADYQVSVTAGERGRHRAAGIASRGRL